MSCHPTKHVRRKVHHYCVYSLGNSDRRGNAAIVRAVGVHAQGLNYLNYLIADPIQAIALYRSGVRVQIPRPERFAIHKLIVADRRQGEPDQAKARKDRGQAEFLIEVLAQDRQDDLREAYADARARGTRWRERIDASLARMPIASTILQGIG